jgi:hypothetical protein
MRENRTYGSEGGETGTTGLPYPYSEDRPVGTERHTCNMLTWRESPASFDPVHRIASDTSILPHCCRRSSHYSTEDRQHSPLPTCVVRRAQRGGFSAVFVQQPCRWLGLSDICHMCHVSLRTRGQTMSCVARRTDL